MNLPVTNIQPGELHVSNEPCRITTLLGSCVSVTVHHTEKGFGGMNHFMLPEVLPERQKGPRDFRFGDRSIRYMLDRMLEYDARPEHLDVKIFGGGRVVSALKGADIGKSNVECAEQVLAEYGLTPSEKRVEGGSGLKLDFNTYTNEVQVEPIRNSDDGTRAKETEERTVRKQESKIRDILSGGEDDGIDFLRNDPE